MEIEIIKSIGNNFSLSIKNIYNYEMDIIYLFHFQVDFNDLDMRIKLEDLKLNIIHHIESLRDETSYRDNLLNGFINQK